MRKNMIRVLCLVVLLVTVLAPAMAMANKGYYYVKCSGKANLRSSRYTHANNRIGQVASGESVLVYDWYENRS